jgi:CheY-like chemotaxis protein
MALPRPSVLVIDGDPVARRRLVRLLQPVAVVAEVDSADCALAAIATGTVFDAVVAREASASAVFAKLRARHPELAGRLVPIASAEPFQPLEIQQLVLAVAGSADFAAE